MRFAGQTGSRRRQRSFRSVPFAVGFCFPAVAERNPEEAPKAAKSASRTGMWKTRSTNQASGIRSSFAPMTSWFVGYQRSGAVRLSPFIVQPVVPLPPMIRWMTTWPAPISCFGHAVGDDLAHVIARPVLDENEVAGVEARQHARAAHHHPVGAAAETLRQAEPEAGGERGRRARRAWRPRAASAAGSATPGAAGVRRTGSFRRYFS